MLKLWNPASDNSHPALFDPADCAKLCRVPKFLHHREGTAASLEIPGDAEEQVSVLVMEDLVGMDCLDTRLEQFAKLAPTSSIDAELHAAGQQLGLSLAMLHSPATVVKVSESPGVAETLNQQLVDQVIWDVSVDALPDYIKGLPDKEELHRRVEEDFKTPRHAYPNVLSHSDFHLGNILLPAADAGPLIPAVIDWEFAHLRGRGVNGDAAELLAGLHYKLVAARNENPRLAGLMRQFIKGFCSAYREAAKLEISKEVNAQDNVNLQLLRSSFLYHGTEMVNCAHEYVAESKSFGEIEQVGLWYLRTAGRDIDEFGSVENMKEVMTEDEGLLTSLFQFPGM